MHQSNRGRLVVASSHRYADNPRLGSSYLAEAMARIGWRVLFIEQPTSPFHLVFPQSRNGALQKTKAVWRQLRRSGQDAGSVQVLNLFSLLPHVNVSPFDSDISLRHWWRATLPLASRALERRGFGDPDAFLFDSPYFFPLARRMGAPAVYRYADRIQEFSGITAAMAKLQDQIFREAELVVATSRPLYGDLAARSRPSVYIPNGVDIDAFRTPWPEPASLTAIPHPRALYAGALDEWFDFDLLQQAVRANPDIHFVLIGKINVPADRLRPFSEAANVHLLGEVSFRRVPAFMQHSDAGIIPFDTNGNSSLVEAVNPLKLYEYCAAGLPVICYRSREIEQMQAPIRVYGDAADFSVALRYELDRDMPAARRVRQDWAGEATWTQRAAMLEQALLELPARTG